MRVINFAPFLRSSVAPPSKLGFHAQPCFQGASTILLPEVELVLQSIGLPYLQQQAYVNLIGELTQIDWKKATRGKASAQKFLRERGIHSSVSIDHKLTRDREQGYTLKYNGEMIVCLNPFLEAAKTPSILVHELVHVLQENYSEISALSDINDPEFDDALIDLTSKLDSWIIASSGNQLTLNRFESYKDVMGLSPLKRNKVVHKLLTEYLAYSMEEAFLKRFSPDLMSGYLKERAGKFLSIAKELVAQS